jgi:hypothetical protein
MFGTLVSTGLDRESLEFIENPDPVAAVSRNVQDTIRIACIHCRARKVWRFQLPCLQPWVDNGLALQLPMTLRPNKMEI